MAAWYNEHDPFAAAWLRELIRDNLIAPGEVDERSIEDVSPDDLRPFRQCHFFAGVGVWSLAARLVGIDDDAPLWSGSCPCQPFSAAGKGGGFDDERHLWPAFFHLIEQSAPVLVVGEQVAGADGDAWLDLVSADMEATGYAFGAAETVACGFGAPHKRTRNYWVGHANGERQGSLGGVRQGPGAQPFRRRTPKRMALTTDGRRDGREASAQGRLDDGQATQRGEGQHGLAGSDAARAVGLADDNGHGLGTSRGARREQSERDAQSRGANGWLDDAPSARHVAAWGGKSGEVEADERKRGSLSRMGRGLDGHGRPGPVNGFWRDADWLRCRDERWRPVEPETFPLVDAGTFRNRVGLLRGAGNAITVGQAAGFLQAVRQSLKF